jgi:TatA/E family protein of Tat protein translocase
MFGLGVPELLVVLGIGLLLFGGKKLPELAKSLGRSVTEFKRGVSGLEEEIEKPPRALPGSRAEVAAPPRA